MSAAAGALRKTAADGSGDEEEEEQQCRICRHPAEPERPLRHPCACRGSIRFVHDDCQLQRLSTTRQSRCEVCGQEISIRPIHGADASALARLASLIVSLLCLILTVKVAWELTSLYLWRLALARSRAEAFRLLSVRPFEPPVLAQLTLRAEHAFHAKYGGHWSRCQVVVLRLLQFSVAVTMVDMVLACTSAFIPFTVRRIILLCTGASSRDSPGASTRSAIYRSWPGTSASVTLISMLWMSLLSLGRGWKTLPTVGEGGELCFQ